MGKHYLLNIYGCSFDLLNDQQFIVSMLTTAADLCQATILNTASHKFTPYGVTAILMLAESHISCHTYPEEGSAYVDIYTCGSLGAKVGCDEIIKQLSPSKVILKYVER